MSQNQWFEPESLCLSVSISTLQAISRPGSVTGGDIPIDVHQRNLLSTSTTPGYRHFPIEVPVLHPTRKDHQ